ncbi:MAG: copper resistance protein CopC [Thermoplasmatota archaeon]
MPLVAVVCVLLAPAALAHADLDVSVPMQGTHLAAPPSRVSVTFTEPIDPVGTDVRVVDAQGDVRDLGDKKVEGTTARPVVSVAMPGSLPDGPYRIVWRALSNKDGHPTSGTVGFAIGFGGQAPAGTTAAAIQVNVVVARFVMYAGFSLAFGAAAFLLWMAPAGYPSMAARVALLGGATLHAAGTLLLAADTAAASGIGFENLASSEVGLVWLVRMGLGVAAWLLALVWTFRPVQAGPAVVTLFLLGSALGSARLGHPFLQGVPTMVLDFLHLVAAATWVGGLVLLLFLVWQAERRPMPIEDLRRAAEGTVAAADDDERTLRPLEPVAHLCNVVRGRLRSFRHERRVLDGDLFGEDVLRQNDDDGPLPT